MHHQSPMAHRSRAASVKQLQTGADKSTNWDPIKVPHGFCSTAPPCVNAHWHVFVLREGSTSDTRTATQLSTACDTQWVNPTNTELCTTPHLSLPPTTPHGTQLALGSNPAAPHSLLTTYTHVQGSSPDPTQGILHKLTPCSNLKAKAAAELPEQCRQTSCCTQYAAPQHQYPPLQQDKVDAPLQSAAAALQCQHNTRSAGQDRTITATPPPGSAATDSTPQQRIITHASGSRFISTLGLAVAQAPCALA